MHSTLVSVLCAGFFVLLSVSLRRRKDDVASLPGPEVRSWIYGNLVEFMLGLPAGKVETDWFSKYGAVHRFRACFGEDRIMILDPAAIKYVLAMPTTFVKSPSHQLINNVGFGPGSLLTAHGDDHRRFRAVMNPMFSAASVRALTPILEKKAHKLADQWSTLSDSVIDVYHSVHKITLQAITEAVMGYDTRNDEAFLASYEDLVHSAAPRSKGALIVDAVLSRLPSFMTKILVHFPPPILEKFLSHRSMTEVISDVLLKDRLRRLEEKSEPENDLFSVLVQHNESMPPASRMNADEIKQQFGTITTAGEDTTANAICWVLYSLALSQKWQDAIRDELNQFALTSAGKSVNYDQFPSLNAVIKETLRFYSTVSFTERVAAEDAVIPLSAPILTSSGKPLTDIRIKKGRRVGISFTAYHRISSVWGDDANEFKPERWLAEEDVASGVSAIGPYANLLTFLGGPRTCIGWRFAVLEIQVVISELLKRFLFSLPDGVTIQPASAVTLVPMDEDGRVRLPLLVKDL